MEDQELEYVLSREKQKSARRKKKKNKDDFMTALTESFTNPKAKKPTRGSLSTKKSKSSTKSSSTTSSSSSSGRVKKSPKKSKSSSSSSRKSGSSRKTSKVVPDPTIATELERILAGEAAKAATSTREAKQRSPGKTSKSRGGVSKNSPRRKGKQFKQFISALEVGLEKEQDNAGTSNMKNSKNSSKRRFQNNKQMLGLVEEEELSPQEENYASSAANDNNNNENNKLLKIPGWSSFENAFSKQKSYSNFEFDDDGSEDLSGTGAGKPGLNDSASSTDNKEWWNKFRGSPKGKNRSQKLSNSKNTKDRSTQAAPTTTLIPSSREKERPRIGSSKSNRSNKSESEQGASELGASDTGSAYVADWTKDWGNASTANDGSKGRGGEHCFFGDGDDEDFSPEAPGKYSSSTLSAAAATCINLSSHCPSIASTGRRSRRRSYPMKDPAVAATEKERSPRRRSAIATTGQERMTLRRRSLGASRSSGTTRHGNSRRCSSHHLRSTFTKPATIPEGDAVVDSINPIKHRSSFSSAVEKIVNGGPSSSRRRSVRSASLRSFSSHRCQNTASSRAANAAAATEEGINNCRDTTPTQTLSFGCGDRIQNGEDDSVKSVLSTLSRIKKRSNTQVQLQQIRW